MTIWQVALVGDPQDLAFLGQTFEFGSCKVLRDAQNSGYLYESDSFHRCNSFQEVEQIAETELATLSGILKLERDSRDALRYGSVYKSNQNGGRDIFVRIEESAHLRDEVSAVVAARTGAEGNGVESPPRPPPRAAVLLALSCVDAAVAKSLRLLSAPDVKSWVNLYRLHEVIEADVGGRHTLEKLSWGSAEDLRRFKHSANSVQVGGDRSRHGNEWQAAPKNPMTLSEAEAYVRYIVQSWLASKGAR